MLEANEQRLKAAVEQAKRRAATYIRAVNKMDGWHDNVKFPDSPKYRAYMREQEAKHWKTEEHKTHVEYQTLLRDLVLESEYMG